jgi:crotonobetainyl-CoA:carnitine CoA-transferase CaiB-like acyl-CoA transferase
MRERRLNTGATVAQDARTPDGRTVLLDLARHCDVLIENFRPGVMDRLGLGETVLREANPRLIVRSISGYVSARATRSGRVVLRRSAYWRRRAGTGATAQARPGRHQGKLGAPQYGVSRLLALHDLR